MSPQRAYVAGHPVRIDVRIAAAAPVALQLDLVRAATGRPARRLALAAVPGLAQHVAWDGLTGSGAVAPGGRYRVRVRAPDGSASNAGALTLHTHIYPIRGRHADRGPIGAFGVGCSGGRTHEGFDVNATGNARTIGCHLHFEIRSRGVPIDPRRELHAWDEWS